MLLHHAIAIKATELQLQVQLDLHGKVELQRQVLLEFELAAEGRVGVLAKASIKIRAGDAAKASIGWVAAVKAKV